MAKILIIQTAFIGDVILATSLVETLHKNANNEIDFLVRKGNESLFENHPYLNEVLVWNKKKNKTRNLVKLLFKIREKKYDYVINLQRYASTGILTAFSGAKTSIGFSKNPFSLLFSVRKQHSFDGLHEIERNYSLISGLTNDSIAKPKLYPSSEQIEKINNLTEKNTKDKYICIAPTSVWYTKQFPVNKWIEAIKQPRFSTFKIYLIGADSDIDLCQKIKVQLPNHDIEIVAGQLSLLESAALLKNAHINFVNDSSPMHLASATNANTCAIYCSTVPKFGFGPLSDHSCIVENSNINCRPCGFHGHKNCPQGHFKCAQDINIKLLEDCL